MAELSPEEKNALSHRGRALRALGDMLAPLWTPSTAVDPIDEETR